MPSFFPQYRLTSWDGALQRISTADARCACGDRPAWKQVPVSAAQVCQTPSRCG
ncbi:hypothetical protein SSKA14_2581 [Stenotrophomonas sp. SKA14]|nr:hypothetical protein SSKA14_2581 [Stenotrophomonas sp. SKA14]